MIVVDNPDHGRALEHLGHPFIPGHDHCVTSVGKDGQLLGGVLYQNYRTRSIEMHMQGFEKGWNTPTLLWAVFDYPFNQLKVDKVIGFVPTDRPEILKFDLKLGFKIEHTIQDVVPGGGLVLISMSRSECRWLTLPRFSRG